MILNPTGAHPAWLLTGLKGLHAAALLILPNTNEELY